MEIFLLMGGVLVFIALVALFIVWFIRKSKTRYAQLWTPLAPLVGGEHKGHRMTGAYEGRAVRARLNSVSDSDNNTSYFFEVVMQSRPGGLDWALKYGGEKLLGFGEKRWHVSAKDDALKDRLARAGLLAEMQAWGAYPTISYKAKRGEIEYSEPVRGMFALPDPERFRRQLELLARAAAVNEQVNAA